MNIAVLSNVNLDFLIKLLGKIHTVFQTEGYGQWIPYALEENPALSRFSPKVIFLLLDGNALLESCTDYEEGQEELRSCAVFIRQMATNYKESILAVSTIDVLPRRIRPAVEGCIEAQWEADWGRELEALARKEGNIVPFDLQGLISETGRNAAYSDKMWYMGSIPYRTSFVSALAATAERTLARLAGVRKKILAIDLDNTIWGGVAGEDGPEGIVLGESLLGAAYRDAQKRIKEIGKTGVLLAAISKNNPEDVKAVFSQNPFMVLKEEDFTAVIANWDPKPQNLRALADDLNLGLDSFVFLDDNEVEREAVRVQLPEVAVADFPIDVAGLPQAVEELYQTYFWCWCMTREDEDKVHQYQSDALRKRDLSVASSLEDYLLSLDIRIILNEVQDDQVSRAVQLLNKTNQFNTNTLRMDHGEFAKYREAPWHHVYVANVSDRYGSSGLVAELLLRAEGEDAYIDNFLMSCRVMGRQIENAILAAVIERLSRMGIRRLHASYAPSGKNKPVEDLWERLGFAPSGEDEGRKLYEIILPAKLDTVLRAEWKSIGS